VFRARTRYHPMTAARVSVGVSLYSSNVTELQTRLPTIVEHFVSRRALLSSNAWPNSDGLLRSEVMA